MKALSLFSGIGGLDIAAQACDIEPLAFCEIEPFPVEILKKRFPGVPILPDVRKVNGHDFGTVDVIFGGFPCQDLSVAGRRAGLLDKSGNATRSGLWFEMLRIISEARPRFVVAENVRGAINAALDVVQSGLESEGYEVRTILLPASAVGAPHQRERIFILAVRNDVYGSLADCDGEGLPWGKETGNDFEERQKSVDEQFVGRSSDCGKWSTPTARDYKGSCTENTYLRRAAHGFPNCLNNQVAHEERNWPAVKARDWNPTGSGHCKNTGRIDLPNSVRQIEERNWPTVTASSNERTGSTQYHEGSMHSANLGQIVDLAERADCKQKTGQLNPAWVEELMGYPRGWTDPGCDEVTPWAGWPARPGEPQFEYEHPRTVTGMKNRAKRLKALGNSVVPQQAEPIFRAVQIIDKLTRKK